MRQHPREVIVNDARLEISKVIVGAREIEFRDLYSMVFVAMSMVIDQYPRAVSNMTFEQDSGNSYAEFVNTFERVRNEKQLTDGECMRILAEELASLAKYEIRQERHPEDEIRQERHPEDPSKPGGLE